MAAGQAARQLPSYRYSLEGQLVQLLARPPSQVTQAELQGEQTPLAP